jgi:hypothetical protein
MHQQLGGSPNDTASNLRAILAALADIDIAGIAPSFDPPHIRILVEDEVFDSAYDAMKAANLEPTVHSAVTVPIRNTKNALRTAMDRLERRGYVVDAVLVLPGHPKDSQGNEIQDHVQVSFGLSPTIIVDWNDERAEALGTEIGDF